MDEFTEPYYAALSQLDFALRRHNYRGALAEVRIGLRHTSAALQSMYDRNGWLPPSIPTIGDTAGMLAALVDDSEMFDQMDAINALGFLLRKVDVPRYRRDAAVIETIRRHLAEVRQATLPELRGLFSADDSARLVRLTNWMEKWGDLTKEKIGSATVLAAGSPDQESEEVPPPFRAGMELQPTSVLRFSRRPVGTDGLGTFTTAKEELYGSGEAIDADTRIDERRLPVLRRQPSMMTTRPTTDGSWLVARSKRLPSGVHSTLVSRYLPDGTWIEPLNLAHAVTHCFSDSNRPEIVTIDRALRVRVYGFDGGLLAGLALGETPEIRKFSEDAVGSDNAIRLRAIDLSSEHGRTVFAYADECWVFSLDGTSVTSVRVPAMPGTGPILLDEAPAVDLQTALVAQGLSADASPREIAEWLDTEGIMPRSLRPAMNVTVVANIREDGYEAEDDDLIADIGAVAELDVIAREVGGLKADWIYYVRFSHDGESIWISTYSGLLARVSLAGTVIDSWILPSYVDNLWEAEDRTFIALHASIAELTPGAVNPPFLRGSGYDTMVGGRVVANRLGRGLTIGNVLTGAVKSVVLARDFRAIYATANGVRVETANTSADIDI